MPRDQVHWRRVRLPAPLAARALQQGLERDVASTLDQQAHGEAYGPSAALKLDHAIRPVGETVLDAEHGLMHAIAWRGNRTGTRSPINHLPRIGFCGGRSDQQQSAAPVLGWKNQAIEILNEPNWSVVNPGPLHHPVLKFTIRRDERFALFIETEAVKGATSTAGEIPPGTVRINTDKAGLGHMFGAKATLSGLNRVRLYPDADPVRERSRIHELTLTLPDRGIAVYTIVWLENLPSHHCWPDRIQSHTDIKTKTTFGEGRLEIPETDFRGASRGAAILEIAGHTLYVCGPEPLDENKTPRSGCIVYEGVPDTQTRKKFRVALSLALGVYLVETGHTLFNKDWEPVAATAITAYSLGGRAFDLPMQSLHVAHGSRLPTRHRSRQADANGRALFQLTRRSRSG
jgi:hypothetical protein